MGLLGQYGEIHLKGQSVNFFNTNILIPWNVLYLMVRLVYKCAYLWIGYWLFCPRVCLTVVALLTCRRQKSSLGTVSRTKRVESALAAGMEHIFLENYPPPHLSGEASWNRYVCTLMDYWTYSSMLAERSHSQVRATSDWRQHSWGEIRPAGRAKDKGINVAFRPTIATQRN